MVIDVDTYERALELSAAPGQLEAVQKTLQSHGDGAASAARSSKRSSTWPERRGAFLCWSPTRRDRTLAVAVYRRLDGQADQDDDVVYRWNLT